MLQQRLLWCTFTSNSAESSGGIYTDSSTLPFTGTSNFTNNSANKGGGAIYALQHVPSFSGTKVVQSAQIISLLKLILPNRDRLFSGRARTLYMNGQGHCHSRSKLSADHKVRGSGSMLHQDHPTKQPIL